MSYLNGRNERQFEVISGLMDAVSRADHEVIVTGHNMTEIAFVLQSVYGMKARSVHDILRALIENPGVEFSAGHYPAPLMAIWPAEVKDYGYAVLASAASVLGAKVFTFDQAFARALIRLDLHADLH